MLHGSDLPHATGGCAQPAQQAARGTAEFGRALHMPDKLVLDRQPLLLQSVSRI
jgi:hypothetical protein